MAPRDGALSAGYRPAPAASLARLNAAGASYSSHGTDGGRLNSITAWTRAVLIYWRSPAVATLQVPTLITCGNWPVLSSLATSEDVLQYNSFEAVQFRTSSGSFTNASQAKAAQDTLKLNRWNLCIATYDETNGIKLYHGLSTKAIKETGYRSNVAGSGATVSSSGSELEIGGRSTGGTDGTVQDPIQWAGHWSRVLTPAEMRILWETFFPETLGVGPPPMPLRAKCDLWCYPGTNGSGRVVDWSGTGMHGTLFNTGRVRFARPMPIRYTLRSPVGVNSSDTRTLNHTAGATATITLGAVFVVATDATPTVSATYDGNAMDAVNAVDDAGNDYHLKLFSIQPTTAPEVVFSSTTTAGLIKAMVAVSYDEVPATAGVRSSVTATGTDDSPTATVTDVETNDKVVAFISWYGAGSIVADTANGEYLVSHTTAGSHHLAIIEKPGTNTTVTLNPILGSAAPWQMVVAAVKSTSGAAYTLTAEAGTYVVTGTAASLEKGFEVAADLAVYAFTGTDASLEKGFKVAADTVAYTLTGTVADLEKGSEVAADSGTYAFTGTDASLEKGFKVAADTTAYVLTGTDATLIGPSGVLAAESGTFEVTGTAANLEIGHRLAADTVAYAVTGTAASLEKGFEVAGDTTAYALTGTDAALRKTYRLAADTVAYAVTGTAASLEKGFKVAADTVVYAITGTAASLEKGFEVAADTVAYAVTGTVANLEKGYRLAADTVGYTYTGTDATFLLGRVLAAETTTYTWTGSEAILSTSPTLNAESGTYVVTGTQAALKKTYRLVADATTYAETGTAASLEKGFEVAADTGIYALTGTAANLERGTRLAADVGAYALTGSNANLLKGSRVAALTTTYVITGSDASLGSNPTLNAEAGTYTLTGTQATLRHTIRMVADAGTYAEGGTAANLEKGSRVAADTTAYAFTGSVASLKKGFYVLAQTTAIAVTGTAANTLAGRKVVADAGARTVTGTAANLSKGYRLAGDATSYTMTGTDAEKRKQYMLQAAPVIWTVDAPIATNLLSTRILRADTDDYTITGEDAYLGPVKSWTLTADPGDIDFTAPATGLVYTPYAVIDLGTFELQETLETLGTVTIAAQAEYVLTAVPAAPTQLVNGTIIAPDQTLTLIVSDPAPRMVTKPLQAMALVILG